MLRALPLLLVLFAAACGGLHGDIQGTWKPDVDAMEGQAKMAAAFIQKVTITEDTITFEAGMAGQSKSESRSYSVKSEDGKKIVLEFDKDGAKALWTIEVDGDRLKMTDQGNTLVLKRS